jgi:DNA-binding NarL/FixJ family response regulator
MYKARIKVEALRPPHAWAPKGGRSQWRNRLPELEVGGFYLSSQASNERKEREAQQSREERSEFSRLVIADDHPLFRSAIRQMLREWPDLVVVGEAADGGEAVKLCRRLQPELVLMDLRMPQMDGVEATRELKRELPAIIVLVLTALEEPDYLLEALKAGASGYLLKQGSPEQIVGAIRRVLDGESPLNQEVAMQLLMRLIEERQQKAPAPKPSLSTPLSPREVEILELLVRGKSNQLIASDLSISMSTVKNHVHNVIRKLGVSDRVQAAILAIECDLISTA